MFLYFVAITIKHCRGHKDVVWCMATRKKKLFTAGADCTIKVWDLDSLQKGCIKTIQGHSKAVSFFANWNFPPLRQN